MSFYTSTNTYNQGILDMKTYNNGRVNILEQPPADIKFDMFDRIAIKNRAVDYRVPMNNGWEDTKLSYAFFSAGNIQIIQNGLRAGVYELSKGKFSITPQNIDQLKVIMRTMFYQYARFSQEPIPEQISQINKHVLDYVIPYLYNEAIAYVKYCEDQSTLVVPLDLPKQNERDYKPLEFKRYF
jgi:hypothetical protein